MKEVKTTVVFPLDLRTMVHDEASMDDIWKAVIDQAKLKDLDPNTSPIIQYCSEPLLVPTKEEEKLESEEDWLNKIRSTILQMDADIKSIMPAARALKEERSKLVDNLHSISLLMDKVISNL